MLTVGSLFSGIGGIELGLERTNKFKVIWNCENDSYASAILKKHWSNIPNLGDITKVKWERIEKPDLICGGFPCQDISIAGKQKGIKEGTRSGLWFEFAKAIRILRPRYVLIENVPMLLNNGGTIVLANLAKIGYDAEWFTLSAAEVGAPHKRERIFIVAYLNSERCRCGEHNIGIGQLLPNTKWEVKEDKLEGNRRFCRHGKELKNTASDNGGKRIQGIIQEKIRRFKEFSWCKNVRRIEELRNRPDIPKPIIRRTSDGFSDRFYKERIRCLGNAVVPAVAQIIGEAIADFEFGVFR